MDRSQELPLFQLYARPPLSPPSHLLQHSQDMNVIVRHHTVRETKAQSGLVLCGHSHCPQVEDQWAFSFKTQALGGAVSTWVAQ